MARTLNDKTKLLLTTVCIPILILVIGIFLTVKLVQYSEQREKRALLTLTSSTAAALSGDQIADLRGVPKDENTHDYAVIRKQLLRIRIANKRARFVYLFGNRNGRVVFLADAEPSDSKDFSPPGQLYTEVTKEERQIMVDNRPLVEGPYRNRSGIWVSGMAPVLDPRTGTVSAVLGIDIDATDWLHSVSVYRWLGITLTVFPIFLLSFFLVNSWRTTQTNVLLQKEINERKRLEDALQTAKEAAETANRAKSIFLANMSHEIRTPLNAILGFSQLMQRDPGLTPQQQQHLDTINRSGEHLLALINDILEMSKIEAGRTTLNPATFDLHELLTDLDAMFRVRTETKKLHLDTEKTADVPQFVTTDEGKLRQVLINLLGNAVKFTEKGGIVLRAGVSGRQNGVLRLQIEIEDTGPGIAPEETEQVFQLFRQSSSGAKVQGGTGLGLAISREFARLMGGDITVRSELGKGSIFRLEMNVAEGKAESAKPKTDSRRVTGLRSGQPKYRVLVADDREENRTLLAQMLENIGFETRQATDGAEAIREFETWQPHLILMDMRMPVMDGYEAIRRIRAKGGDGGKVPIISVSASAFDKDRHDMLAASANDFLPKPFREADLFDKIRKLLGVEYTYADKPTGKPQEAERDDSGRLAQKIACLPAELVSRMREAVTSADFDRVLELVGQIELNDARLAGTLRELTERFDYDRLLELLNTGKTA